MGGPESVTLEVGTLAFGDLHLDPADTSRCDEFVGWLGSLAGIPRLVILGDLFEYWVGPAQERMSGMAEVLGALADFPGAIDLIPGNRDFLLGRGFEQRTGARVHPDGLLGRTGAGATTLFLHGDELCTADHAYQRLRRVLRSGPVRWLAPHLPGAVALVLARRLRAASRRAVESKAPLEVAMDDAEVLRRSTASGAATLICGHAHRFRREELAGGVRWIVLDAWGGPRDLLGLGPDGLWEARGHGAAAI